MKTLTLIIALSLISCNRSIQTDRDTFEDELTRLEYLTKFHDSVTNKPRGFTHEKELPYTEAANKSGLSKRRSYESFDEYVRRLRDENPNLIISVPGHPVHSLQQDFEGRMEDYIDENHDDIIEKYSD